MHRSTALLSLSLRGLLLLAFSFIAVPTVNAQSASAQQPRRVPSMRQWQYKKVHRDILAFIAEGNSERAIAFAERYLESFPDDLESLFMKTYALADLGRQEEAIACMQQTIELGMPAGRFLVHTMPGSETLQAHEAWQALQREHLQQPIHGPMLGDITPCSGRVWLRTGGEANVGIIYSTTPLFDNEGEYLQQETDAEDDYTALFELTDLEPDTNYYYAILINGELCNGGDSDGRFHTLPTETLSSPFRIAFGGGAGYTPENERMWNTIDSFEPSALMLLGDNVYVDDITRPVVMKYCYYRRQSRPEFRSLINHTPIYSIWDDHDFGMNDSHGGPEIDTPAWKRTSYDTFCDNWANPAYGGGEEQPGCWYDFHQGDLHFIMLDCRYYRTAPRGAMDNRSMLGPVQLAWLKETIANSEGTFKIICSSVPWTFLTKGNSPDTWNGYQTERNEIFDFLRDEAIEGVVLVSADRHRSDLWRIEHEGMYDLFEFNSSRMTNQNLHPEMERAEFSYNDLQSFGLIDFDLSADDPTVTYRIMNIEGEEVFAREFLRSDLDFD